MGFIDTEDYRHAQTILRQQEARLAGREPRKKDPRPWQPREPQNARARRPKKSKKGFSIRNSVKEIRLRKRGLAEFFGE